MRYGKKTVLASTCKAEVTGAGGSFKAAGTGKSHKGCKSKSTEKREPLANCGLRLPDSRRNDEKARETPTSHEHDGAHGADADGPASDILPVDERFRNPFSILRRSASLRSSLIPSASARSGSVSCPACTHSPSVLCGTPRSSAHSRWVLPLCR